MQYEDFNRKDVIVDLKIEDTVIPRPLSKQNGVVKSTDRVTFLLFRNAQLATKCSSLKITISFTLTTNLITQSNKFQHLIAITAWSQEFRILKVMITVLSVPVFSVNAADRLIKVRILKKMCIQSLRGCPSLEASNNCNRILRPTDAILSLLLTVTPLFLF